MTSNEGESEPGQYRLVVVEDDGGHNIPDTMDESLYAEREGECIEFDISPDDDIVEVLQANGYSLPWTEEEPKTA